LPRILITHRPPGNSGTLRWGPEDDPAATIAFALLPEDGDADRATAVRLSYTVRPRRGENTEHEYTVPLEYTECNFGGSRPWFRCPGVVDGVPCRDRVAKLYCPPGGEVYACRECHDLGYQSSRKSGNRIDTALLRYQRAFAKADAEGRRPHPNNRPYSPDRPKGMHQDTFADLVDDVEDARDEWHGAVNARLYAMSDGEYGVLF
jgi:hypothetical protein